MGGARLTITLTDDVWSLRPADVAAAESTGALRDVGAAMLAQSSAPFGWNAQVRPRLQALNASLEGGTLAFDLPPIDAFYISEPETISLRLPSTAVGSAAELTAFPPLVIRPEPRTVRFGGHLYEHPHEETLQSLGTNLSLVLDGDAWQPFVGQPHLGPAEHALAVQLLHGLRSAQSEVGGWHAVVLPGLRPDAIRRLDDRQLVITIPPTASYAIRAQESIVAVVPPEALLSAVRPTLAAALVVRPSAGRARLSGSLLREASEEAVKNAATLTLAITLEGDAWRSTVGRQGLDDDPIAQALLDGLQPRSQEPRGWAATVRPALRAIHVSRTGPQTVTIHIAPSPSYDIAAPEVRRRPDPNPRPLVGTPLRGRTRERTNE